MVLVIGLIVWTVAHIYFIKKLDKLEINECPYDISFCRDVRATDGMITDGVMLEQRRYYVNKKSSKF
ncbi:MAG: hypothetical protein IJ419_07285 [Agathobacter sp.]|nr:hypothetical protein [Agathobacter sp.]